MKKVIVIIGLLLVLTTAFESFSVIREDEYGIRTRFREIVGVSMEAGPHFKIPFIEKYEKVTARSLTYDSEPTDFVTSDKKNIRIDTYGRFRIVDPEKFRTTASGSLATAQSFVDDIVYSVLREEAAKLSFSEIIDEKRKELQDLVTEITAKECEEQYGLNVLSVRIKRAGMPKENEQSVYNRMKAERLRQANEYRSEGQEKAQEIRATTNKEREIILAEAYKQAQELIGEGEQEALKIYAEAFNKDPEFYEFLRSLETYKKTFGDDTTIVLSSDDPFLRFFNSGK